MVSLEQPGLREISKLELLANQVVEGFIVGLHQSPFHGFSVEFAEHRIYNQGESTRNIDWKVYARTDRMYSKRFEEETNLRCQLVIDASSSMQFPISSLHDANDTQNKFIFSALGAASLMNIFRRQRDAFGLDLFDDTLKIHTEAKSSTAHYKLLLSHLEKQLQQPGELRTTNAAEVLHEIAERIHKRSLVIIFSDMMEDPTHLDEIFASLQHLKHNKHEVILFHTVDHSKEIEFQYENRPHLFIDLETGEKIRLRPKEVEKEYRLQMSKVQEQIRMNCLQFKIELIEADITKGYKPILQAYLAKRNRMGV
ncbi:MAG: DUF58 domain-containing protein [Saprospiraceae bacterium]|jgi:uncharacterized protein (DUF58 family)|nr:DUF58 domain-containing protein [Saprospiraceae bacterium]MBK6477538.1 DUF58 domain-containing protein [Saprospiraceae bacterium]MBK6816589.1 DUF58 domain-containing protein [Saprospiraceae bacterium]MBK7371115.1 DUF58 domain-containing protein [Saprospiraceae bacterium]MBK7436385.1 DUF58 domain-containing protein [Saprospiraceae bacterium]